MSRPASCRLRTKQMERVPREMGEMVMLLLDHSRRKDVRRYRRFFDRVAVAVLGEVVEHLVRHVICDKKAEHDRRKWEKD